MGVLQKHMVWCLGASVVGEVLVGLAGVPFDANPDYTLGGLTHSGNHLLVFSIGSIAVLMVLLYHHLGDSGDQLLLVFVCGLVVFYAPNALFLFVSWWNDGHFQALLGCVLSLGGVGTCVVRYALCIDPCWSPPKGSSLHMGAGCVALCLVGCLMVWSQDMANSMVVTSFALMSCVFGAFAVGYEYQHCLRLVAAFLPSLASCFSIAAGASAANSGQGGVACTGHVFCGISLWLAMGMLAWVSQHKFGHQREIFHSEGPGADEEGGLGLAGEADADAGSNATGKRATRKTKAGARSQPLAKDSGYQKADED